jgi:predicted Zn-dependent peptidase
MAALTRRLYPAAHPNYKPAPEAELETLQGTTLEQVKHYHDRHFGATAFNLVLVGDIDAEAVVPVLEESLGDWGPHGTPPGFERKAAPREAGRVVIAMPDKQNVDVRIGHTLELNREDPDYIPLYVAMYILGGNFSSRLMDIIRDEMGLTYHVRAGIVGVTTEYEGAWRIAITLSQENIERGIEATVEQVRRFVEEGVTVEELEETKTTIAGAFKVNLADTEGLSKNLLLNAERGFDVGYLDRYPAEIEAVSLAQVNEVIRRHVRPGELHYALAGSV